MDEVLTPEEMRRAEAAAIASGPADGYGLMLRAGRAVHAILLERFPGAAGFDVLCGPGNNGGDGYVVARLLAEDGADVALFAAGAPRAASDAARAASDCALPARPLVAFRPAADRVVVDALFGAGLARGLSEEYRAVADRCAAAGVGIVAIDLPSGVDGRDGTVTDAAFEAALTVTFQRLKPGHLLQPGRRFCGETIVADIGVPDDAVAAACDPQAPTFSNGPAPWRHLLRPPRLDAHKYSRGHCAVLSGGPASTGAARLAAAAAARIGAGAVTVLSPGSALAVNAAHLTGIMLRRLDAAEELGELLVSRRVASAVIGPGFGVGPVLRDHMREMLRLLAAPGDDVPLAGGVVLDADALTVLAGEGRPLLEGLGGAGEPVAIMTPHEGEFRRLFPDLAEDRSLSKLDRAREAAREAGAVLVYKGPDTVIAHPDGRAAIGANGSPWLATAGSGDVLSGMIGGLLAQRWPPFEAACAAVWMHAEAAGRFGPGLIAEDLPGEIPGVLRELFGSGD